MITAVFDTETTGLIESRLSRLEFQPHLIQVCCVVIDLDSGERHRDFDTYVRPPRLELITEKITEITRITQAMVESAPPFAAVFPRLFEIFGSVGSVLAHNLSYDKEIVDIECVRIEKKMRWPRRFICTVEQSVHVLGYNADLTTLHEKLLGSKFSEAHSARADVEALVACALEMRRRDML